jgi:hypothetical protein
LAVAAILQTTRNGAPVKRIIKFVVVVVVVAAAAADLFIIKHA